MATIAPPPGYTTQTVQNQSGGGQTTLYTPVSSLNPVATPALPPTTPGNIVDTSKLGSMGSTPYTTLGTASTGAASTGLAETALAAKDAALASLQAQNNSLQTEDTTSKTTQQGILSKLGLEEENRQTQYQSSGVNQLKQDVTDITNDIDATSRNYDNQIKTVQSNTQGRTDGGTDVVVNALNQQKASVLADKAILLSAKTNNYNTAKGIIDAQVDAETTDLKTQLQGLQYFYTQNEAKLSDNQKTILTDKIQAADQEYQDAKDTRNQINQLKLTAAQNGAPLSVLQNIGKATTVDEGIQAIGAYASDPLDRALKQAQLTKAYADIKKTQGGVTSLNANDILKGAPAGTTAADANTAALTAIGASGKVDGTNQTNLGLILGVVDAAKQFAANNSDGTFAGINPLTGLLNSGIALPQWLGGETLGLPFRNSVKSPDQLQNEGYINGINLKLQQWASGASLSPAQTAQVQQLAPDPGDTDEQVKTKLNNLVNFMYTQAQGPLETSGINFTPAKVDLFKTVAPTIDDAKAEDIFNSVVGNTGITTSTPAKVSLGNMFNLFNQA